MSHRGDLEGRLALVTGGSRGIGRAVAEGLAGRGARVAVGYLANAGGAEETVRRIEVAGAGEAVPLAIDVSETASVEAAFARLDQDLGPVEVLVNSAGISRDDLLVRCRDEAWQRSLEVNLSGAFRCTRAAARRMMRGGWGRIVYLSSVVAEEGSAGQAAYGAAKAGLHGLTRSLARELAGRSITVNAVAPGFIDTDMTRALPEERRRAILSGIPLGTAGTCEDVAACVAFLASEDARYVTGQVLAVNGGMAM